MPADEDAPPPVGGEASPPVMPTFEPIGTDEDLPF
jgi:hypothetical protein